MPEQGDEELQATPRSARADRAEAVATLVALLWVSTVAIVFAVYGGNISLVGFLAIAPFIAAAFARPSRVALVGLLAAFFALVLSAPPHSYGELNHTLRVVTQLAATALAMWISYLRGQRNVQLWTARSETGNERAPRGGRDGAADAGHGPGADDGRRPGPGGRRRVRRPARRAARRRRHLRPAGRAGPAADAPPLRLRPRRADRRRARPRCNPTGPCWARTWPSSPSRSKTCAANGPTSTPRSSSSRFRALAIVPLVVSDHTIGAVVVHWDDDRDITEPDRSFLFTITGAAAQAVERARLTLTEFVNLERSQHLHQLSSALAAATTPGDVAHAAIAGGRRALGAQSAVVRVPAAGERTLACLASSGHPALLSRGMVPVDGSDAGACFARGRTVVVTIGEGEERRRRRGRGARAAGAVRAVPAGDDRHRAARRERRASRRALARLRGRARAERAGPPLPFDPGRARPPRRSSGRRCSSTNGRRCAPPRRAANDCRSSPR